MDEEGGTGVSGPIGFAQVLIAHLTQKLRRTIDGSRVNDTGEGAPLPV